MFSTYHTIFGAKLQVLYVQYSNSSANKVLNLLRLVVVVLIVADDLIEKIVVVHHDPVDAFLL